MEPTTFNDVVKHLAEAAALLVAGLTGWAVQQIRQLRARFEERVVQADALAHAELVKARATIDALEAKVVALGGRRTPGAASTPLESSP